MAIKNMQTKLNKKTIREVGKYRQLLKNARVNFDSLIVFGSQAKGIAKSHSDIDLCVVSKDFGRDRYSERVGLMHITDDETIDIEPHPYHPNDLKDNWDPLAFEIQKYGVVVF